MAYKGNNKRSGGRNNSHGRNDAGSDKNARLKGEARPNGEMNQQTISDIIRGMQYAVNTAQDMLQKHQVALFEKYFDPETGSPYMHKVLLPDGRELQVPLLSLVPSGMLAIDELEMDFSVHVASAEVKSYAETNDLNSKGADFESERSSLSVFFSGIGQRNKKNNGDDETDVIQVKIKFKSIEEPESAARIRELLYTSVQ